MNKKIFEIFIEDSKFENQQEAQLLLGGPCGGGGGSCTSNSPTVQRQMAAKVCTVAQAIGRSLSRSGHRSSIAAAAGATITGGPKAGAVTAAASCLGCHPGAQEKP